MSAVYSGQSHLCVGEILAEVAEIEVGKFHLCCTSLALRHLEVYKIIKVKQAKPTQRSSTSAETGNRCKPSHSLATGSPPASDAFESLRVLRLEAVEPAR